MNTVEPRYNEVLGTMKITLFYQGKNTDFIKSWDQQNYLVIRGYYIRPLYNEVPLYNIQQFALIEVSCILCINHKRMVGGGGDSWKSLCIKHLGLFISSLVQILMFS